MAAKDIVAEDYLHKESPHATVVYDDGPSEGKICPITLIRYFYSKIITVSLTMYFYLKIITVTLIRYFHSKVITINQSYDL